MKYRCQIFALCFVGLISCEKTAFCPDTTKPQIELIYPKNLPPLDAGSPLCIKSVITDDSQLDKIICLISDAGTKSILYREDFEACGSNFVLDKTIILPSAWKGAQLVEISATDIAGNQSTVQFPFEVNQ